jgi:LmbE family N-acetylglucosaminyl deacetylase
VQLPERKVALSLMAHPDDAEFLCAGTLALLHARGWEIHIATMAPGDKGTAVHTAEEIAAIRRKEGADAAAVLDGTYHCLESRDLYITYDKESLNRATALMRAVQPSLVFTTSPSDYMVDHDTASKIAQTACFACGVKNMECDGEPFEPIPWLYYADPVELKDRFGAHVAPGMWVDVTSVLDTKVRMLQCHASQRDWLLHHHGGDEYTKSLRTAGAARGKEVGWDYAEGFRQHLGHAYPQENALKEILGDLVKESR